MSKGFGSSVYHFVHILELDQKQPSGNFRTFPIFFVISQKALKYVNKKIQLSQDAKEVFGCLKMYKSMKLQKHQIKRIESLSKLFSHLTSSSFRFCLLPIKSETKLSSIRGTYLDYDVLMKFVDMRSFDYSSSTVLEILNTRFDQANFTFDSLREQIESGEEVEKCVELMRIVMEELHGKLLVTRKGLQPRFSMICRSVDFKLSASSKIPGEETTFKDVFIERYPKVKSDKLLSSQPIIISNGNFSQQLNLIGKNDITKDFYHSRYESTTSKTPKKQKKKKNAEEDEEEKNKEKGEGHYQRQEQLSFCLPQYFNVSLVPTRITHNLKYIHEILKFISMIEKHDSNLRHVQRKFNLKFDDPLLLQESLTHRTFANLYPQFPSNERLEFLGDAVLDIVVSEFLFREFPVHGYSRLKVLRERIVSNKNLKVVGERMELLNYALLSNEKEKKHLMERSRKTLADFVESIIGALFLDKFSFRDARRFIRAQVLKKEHTNPVYSALVSDSKSTQEEEDEEEEDEGEEEEETEVKRKVFRIFGKKKYPLWMMSYEIPLLNIGNKRKDFENFMSLNHPKKKKSGSNEEEEEEKKDNLIEKMKILENRLGIRFKNQFMLLEAITHNSFQNHQFNLPELDVYVDEDDDDNNKNEEEKKKKKSFLRHYERLCFLGESVLKFVASLHFFQTFPQHTESDYSKHVTRMLSKSMIYENSLKKLDLESTIRIDPKKYKNRGGFGSKKKKNVGEEEEEEEKQQQIISDDKFKIIFQCFKAIVGAVYMENGMLYLNEKICHKNEMDLRFGFLHNHVIIPYTKKMKLLVQKQKRKIYHERDKKKEEEEEETKEEKDTRDLLMDFDFGEDYRTKLHNLLIYNNVRRKYKNTKGHHEYGSSGSGKSFKQRKMKHVMPKYRVLSRNYEGKVKFGCYYNGSMIGVGFGRSEKSAMMNAARDTFFEFKEYFEKQRRKMEMEEKEDRRGTRRRGGEGDNPTTNIKKEEKVTIVTDALEEKVYRCELCNKSFKKQGLYEEHEKELTHVQGLQMKVAMDQIEMLKKQLEEMKAQQLKKE